MGRRELAYDVLLPICVVFAVGAAVVLISGAWPPLVAVESGSMEPNTVRGDLVVLTAPDRFAPAGADGAGIVTAAAAGVSANATDENSSDAPAAGYGRLGGPGDAVVFDPPGRTGSPIFHRVAFAVEADENWYDRADDRLHDADSCDDLAHCPAPHAGYITIGDNNARYDQADDIAPPVKPEWIQGKAQFRVPLVGWLRLGVDAVGEFLFVSNPLASGSLERVGGIDSPVRIASVSSTAVTPRA